MQVLVALAVGLVFWISAWAFGVKSVDAFLVCMALVVGAATVYVFRPLVLKQLRRGLE